MPLLESKMAKMEASSSFSSSKSLAELNEEGGTEGGGEGSEVETSFGVDGEVGVDDEGDDETLVIKVEGSVSESLPLEATSPSAFSSL